ncbi:NmrA family NAD(P)-binding protein [Flavobacterium rhizosphaerae]|uniref:NAD(P)H-binding protein n=1 Tax=Flavobacterium rhizosphaerae TaxID=3163298 RepID=A0ABW8Z099_9FLAO
MKIVLTGSLGHISKPLAEKLLSQGHNVTIISSAENKRGQIEKLGATSAIGSVSDAAFLTQTFTGADAVYCMLPPNFAEQDQIAYYKKLAAAYTLAIKAANVKRVVHLSSYGAHLSSGTGFILGSHESEKIFNTLTGVALTHIRPGYFYYNLLNFIPMIKQGNIIAANYGGEDRVPMVAPEDIAIAVAEEITAMPESTTIRYVASNDLSCNEAAAIIGKAIEKPQLQWITISNEEMQQGMESNGIPTKIAALFTELGAATHSGILREDYDKNQPLLGNIKLRDFAKKFAAAYNK